MSIMSIWSSAVVSKLRLASHMQLFGLLNVALPQNTMAWASLFWWSGVRSLSLKNLAFKRNFNRCTVDIWLCWLMSLLPTGLKDETETEGAERFIQDYIRRAEFVTVVQILVVTPSVLWKLPLGDVQWKMPWITHCCCVPLSTFPPNIPSFPVLVPESYTQTSNNKKYLFSRNRFGSVDKALACGLKGPRFDSSQGHVPWLCAHPQWGVCKKQLINVSLPSMLLFFFF